MTSVLALERWFPGVLGRLPRSPVTTLPTPVQALDRLASAQGLASLWVKRDDRSGRFYGGNKPRKLEFLLAAAQRRGRRSVITFGGIGTNHGLATTICAQQVGLRTILVLVPQPVTDHVRHNLLLDHAYGAELHFAPSLARAAAVAAALCVRGFVGGDRPHLIPIGGSSACGAIGYVNAGLELAEQVQGGELPEPDFIFVPVGSGGTHAGLVAGLRLGGLRSRVVGVLVTDILPPSTRRLAALAKASVGALRRAYAGIPDVCVSAGDFTLLKGHLGAGYGAPTEEAVEAQRLMADLEGIQLETTYSAKCLAGLLRAAGDGEYRTSNLLFWNTFSSIDPAGGCKRVPDFHELPQPFHRFFDRATAG